MRCCINKVVVTHEMRFARDVATRGSRICSPETILRSELISRQNAKGENT